MIRSTGPTALRLVANSTMPGDFVDLPISDMAVLRADITVTDSLPIAKSISLGFKFLCSHEKVGSFFEADSATRIIFNTGASTTNVSFGSTDIDVRGFIWARMQCVAIAALIEETNINGIVRLTAFSDVKIPGLIGDELWVT